MDSALDYASAFVCVSEVTRQALRKFGRDCGKDRPCATAHNGYQRVADANRQSARGGLNFCSKRNATLLVERRAQRIGKIGIGELEGRAKQASRTIPPFAVSRKDNLAYTDRQHTWTHGRIFLRNEVAVAAKKFSSQCSGASNATRFINPIGAGPHVLHLPGRLQTPI